MTSSQDRSVTGTWRLFAPALVGWTFCAVAVGRPGWALAVTIIAMCCGITALVWWVARGRTRTASRAASMMAIILTVSAALMLLGARIIHLEAARDAPELVDAATQGSVIDLKVTLDAFPEQNKSEFGIRAWSRAHTHTPQGRVPLLLWLPNDQAVPSTWAPGTSLKLSGRLSETNRADSAFYTVQVHGLEEERSGSLWAAIGACAALFRQALVLQAAEVSGAELVPGFAVGDTSLVTPQLEQRMLESSLTHLVAVSGSNTSLVVAATVWLSARLGAGLRVRLSIAALLLAAFVIVVGPDASVQRATVMATVMLVSGFGGKRGVSLPALGLAVIVLLVLDPWQALHPGFALSVAATAGILLCATPISGWLQRTLRLPKVIALAFAVAIAAQFSCGPLLLLMHPGIPAVGVLANVLAAPAAPLGTGLGLIAAVLAPVASTVAHFVVLLASVPARWIAAVAEFTPQLPFARWHWPDGWPGALTLAACELTLLVAWWLRTGRVNVPGIDPALQRLPWHPRPAQPVALRLLVWSLSSASIGVVIAITTVTPLTQQLATPRGWSVVACDVGQGDALLIRDPTRPREVMLIDTGDDAELLQRCLARFGVTRVALVVLSHDDRDHVGALGSVLHMADAALVSPTPRGATFSSREVVQQLVDANIPHRVGSRGDSGESGGLKWQVLAPSATAQPDTTNAASLIMRVQAAETRVLLLGDAGESEQDSLLRAERDLSAQVLKVAHHGSRDQSSRLPGRVAAQWALISVGAENRYGHPTDQVLTDLAGAHSSVLRTDLHGSIALVPEDDGTLVPWLERGV